MTQSQEESVTGVVLAGGAGRRMGGADKGLMRLHGQPLAQIALERLRPQVQRLAVSANRNTDAYAAMGVPVIRDGLTGFQGPLAGLLAALDSAGTPLVACVPCDTPDFPADLVQRLREAMGEAADAAYAMAAGRSHPVFCLVRSRLAASLRSYLAGGGRRVEQWLQEVGAVVADFGPMDDAFRNLNTPEDLTGSLPAGTS